MTDTASNRVPVCESTASASTLPSHDARTAAVLAVADSGNNRVVLWERS